MPTYVYRCLSCEEEFEMILSIAKSDSLQACEVCGSDSKKIITPTNFILKGDDWAGKASRISTQMREKSQRLASKQEERRRDGGAGVKLVPNVDGERVDSWSDARKLAESKGKATSTYDAMIRAEKKT